MNLLEALTAEKPFRADLAVGVYELRYSFTAPGFDPESTNCLFDGRRTGPWDYAPWGTSNDGDCLLPKVTLRSSTGEVATARVFIPRESELRERFFNGRIGFRVAGEGATELRITTSLPVQWRSAEFMKIGDFSDTGLARSDFKLPQRFFLSDRGLETLRGNWKTSAWAAELDSILDDCGRFPPPRTLADARRVVSRYLKTSRRYEDDVIFWGDYLATLSLRTLVLEREEDFRRLVEWTDALVDTPVWGDSDDPQGRDHNNDLTADFNMFGLVIAFNWHGGRFGHDRCVRIKEKIAYQAAEMLRWIVGSRSSWPGATTQNHAFFGYQTLVMAGAALLDDPAYPQALDFLRIGGAAFRRFVQALPSDGSYHEGLGYISFGLQGLIPGCLLLTQLTGRNFLPDRWLDAHIRAMNAITPEHPGRGFFFDDGNGYFPANDFVTVWMRQRADDPEVRRAASELLLKFRRYREIQSRDEHSLCHDFWKLVLAPEVTDPAALLPDREAPVRKDAVLLEAAGIFSVRLPGERQVYFHSAPPHGHEQYRNEKHTYSYGHHHPDTGNVTLFDRGRWVLADTGYTVRKSSSEHNVLLVNGRGQYNDNYVWMAPPPFDLNPTRAGGAEADGVFQAENELAWIYPPEAGLRSWVRRVKVSDDFLLVEDRIALERPAPLCLSWVSELPWSPSGAAAAENASGWKFAATGSEVGISSETIRPVRRMPEGEAQLWYALRLHSPEAVTRWCVRSLFLAPDSKRTPQEAAESAGR